jgi:AcrR family transcriptional regulator
LAEAARVFQVKGYDDTSMDDVAEQMGQTKASIYYYFKSKEDLLYSILEQSLDNALRKMELIEASNADALERLHHVLLDHFKTLNESFRGLGMFVPRLWSSNDPRARVILGKERQYQAKLKTIIEDGQRSGTIRSTNAQLTTFAILGMCNWAVRWMPAGHWTPVEVAGEFSDLIRRGLAPSSPDGASQ